jgi:hypothetical protein
MMNGTRKEHSGLVVSHVLLVLTVFMMAPSCGRPRGELFPALHPPLLWPAPPETPRLQYLGQIATENDLKKGVSPLEDLTRTLFGEKEIGILVGPHALALDEEQRLYVSDTSGRVIHLMNMETRAYQQFSQLSFSSQ